MKNLKKFAKEIFVVLSVIGISTPQMVAADQTVVVRPNMPSDNDNCDRIRGCDNIGNDQQDASPIYDFGNSEGKGGPAWTPELIAQVNQMGDRRTDVRCVLPDNGTTSLADLETRKATAQQLLGSLNMSGALGSIVTQTRLAWLADHGIPGGVVPIFWVTYADGGMEFFSYNPATMRVTESRILFLGSGKYENTSKCNQVG